MSLESTLFRIISGKVAYREGSYIYDPSLFVKKIGRKIYDECLEFIDDDVLDDRQIQITLMENGVWDSFKEKKLKELPKTIEDNKVRYFQNYTNPSVRKSYKKAIEASFKELMSLSRTRYKYNSYTSEGIATSAMWLEMINYMYKGEDKIGALSYYHSNLIEDEEIREIALSGEWGSYSALSKAPLKKSPLKMTDYQRKLLSWTNVYRNSSTHPEFPGTKIMEDHDAFDGWMILLNRKEISEKANKVHLDKLKPNTRNVFIGAQTKEDYDEIMALNSPEILAKIKAGI